MFRIFVFLITCQFIWAQGPYTANDTVPPYDNPAYFGTNMGYFEGWTDDNLATMAAGDPEKNIDGIGANTFRPAMFDYFIEQHGLNVRVNTFEHYQKLGMRDLVCFIGYPSKQNLDPQNYCDSEPSQLFKGMYEPIWAPGQEGVEVNEKNTYAVFVKKAVDTYTPAVKIWEIWNEPDFTFTGNGDRPSGENGNWWDRDPPPCEISIKAPIQHYVRMLRIAYAVIKTFHPEDLVAVGGLGYESFLDAIMRNTDNPEDGSVTDEFPLQGGAYFDVLSYHVYPHINGSLRNWNNLKFGFDYYRHSDAAAQAVIDKQYSFENLLSSYGYNNERYPAKHTILTEANIPRIEIDDFIGSELAQRNFVMKSLVLGMANNIKQYHIYNLAEGAFAEGHTNDFNTMGLYHTFNGAEPLKGRLTESGIGFKTIADLFKNMAYEPSLTQYWDVPNDIKVYGFENDDNKKRYVLWAKTQNDRDENVAATFELPDESSIMAYNLYRWDYGQSLVSQTISGRTVHLGASPVIIEPVDAFTLANELYCNVYPNPYSDSFMIEYDIPEETSVKLEIYDVSGKMVQLVESFDDIAPGRYRKVVFDRAWPAGVYFVKLSTPSDKITKKILKQ